MAAKQEEIATLKKENKGGLLFRYKPTSPILIMEDPNFVEILTREGCIRFYQKLQGH